MTKFKKIIFISLIVFLALFLLRAIFCPYEWKNIAPDAQTFQDEKIGGNWPKGLGGGTNSVNDSDPGTWRYSYGAEEGIDWIGLKWKKPIKFDKIVINFGAGRFARHYQIFATVDNKEFLVNENNQNQKDFTVNNFTPPISAQNIKIKVLKTNIDQFSRINEIQVLQKERISLFASIWINFLKPIGSLLILFVATILVLLSFLIPGLSILSFKKNIQPKNALTFSFGISFILLALLSLLAINTTLFVFWLWPVFVLFALLIIFKKKYYLSFNNRGSKDIFLILVMATGFLVLTRYIFQEADFSLYQEDFYLPLQFVRILLSNLDLSSETTRFLNFYYPLSDRPPFLPFLVLPYIYFLGDRFFVYLLISAIISIPFLLPLKLFLDTIIEDEQKSTKIIFLILLIPFIWYIANLSPYRPLMLYFLFLYFYFIRTATGKFIDIFKIGVSSSIALLSHLVFLPYLVFGWLYFFWRKPKFKTILIILSSILINIVFLLPYFLWSRKVSNGIIDRILPFFHTAGIGTQPTNQDPINIINRLWNLLGLFFPNPKSGIHFSGFYFNSFIGAMTIILFLMFLFKLPVIIKKFKTELICILIPGIFYFVFLIKNYYTPLVSIEMPLVILSVIMAGYGLFSLKNNLLIKIILIIFFLESLLVMWLPLFPVELLSLSGNIPNLILAFGLLFFWYLILFLLLTRTENFDYRDELKKIKVEQLLGRKE